MLQQQGEIIATAVAYLRTNLCKYSNLKISLDGSNPGFLAILLLARREYVGTCAVMIATPAAAAAATTTTGNATTTTITPSSSSAGIELSPQPVYQEQISNVSQTPINQTHIEITFSGNGALRILAY